MKNRLLIFGIVSSLFICNYVTATAMIPVQSLNTSVMDLNQQVLNTGSNKAINKTYNKANYQAKPATRKNLSQKDLQLDAYVEKTRKVSLYTNRTPSELQMLVSRIGRQLVNNNEIDQSVQFKYVDSDTVNANTNINNRIVIYKGLIKFCDDKAELAYVIGHELGHATSYHVVKTVATKTAGNFAKSMAAGAISSVMGNSFAIAGTTFAVNKLEDMGQKKYSRVQEFDADFLGIDYIVNAGYNPLASISIIYKIGENYADLWSDHPSTDKRIIAMYNYIKKKYPQYLERGYDSEAYNQAIEYYIHKR